MQKIHSFKSKKFQLYRKFLEYNKEITSISLGSHILASGCGSSVVFWYIK